MATFIVDKENSMYPEYPITTSFSPHGSLAGRPPYLTYFVSTLPNSTLGNISPTVSATSNLLKEP